ncbi:hypothetical protein GF386_05300 [Candidatus Pacearchaeota archaeon]|nr:hypothetical protein [Candidatus Pacearchaeota archaeon]
MAKIGTFVIGMILVSLFVGVFGIVISQGTVNYGVTFDNSSLSAYKKMDNLTDMHEDLKEGVEEDKERTGALDLIGSFFSNSYKTLKITLRSIDLFEDMGEQAVDDAHLGDTAPLFKSALIGIVILVIILTIISLVIARKSGEV